MIFVNAVIHKYKKVIYFYTLENDLSTFILLNKLSK